MMKEVIQQTPEDPRVCKFGSQIKQKQKVWDQDFPGGPVHKNAPANKGTRVQSLVQEDSTCLGANKPMCHNY